MSNHILSATFSAGAMVVLATAVACGGGSSKNDAGAGDGGACLKSLALDCQPSIEPTYDSIYRDVLLTTCGSPTSGKSCHGPDGNQGGLVLSDHDRAYDLLLGHVKGSARVLPKDPKCSILVERLESKDKNFRMPRGMNALPAGQRCAVEQWIANGAAKQ
jgi:hypothetical protein